MGVDVRIRSYVYTMFLAALYVSGSVLNPYAKPSRIGPNTEELQLFTLWVGLLLGTCVLFALRALVLWLYLRNRAEIRFGEIFYYIALSSLPLVLVDLLNVVILFILHKKPHCI